MACTREAAHALGLSLDWVCLVPPSSTPCADHRIFSPFRVDDHSPRAKPVPPRLVGKNPSRCLSLTWTVYSP